VAHATLDPSELRELVSAEVVLESLAVRQSPPFDPDTIERLRGASTRMHAAVADPVAAARAEEDFHQTLLHRCRDSRLVATLGAIQQSLMPYRHAAPVGALHADAIIEALERGDNEAAADRIRDSFHSTLARLLAGVDRTALASAS
jgi:DNA-binding GntR family transcriptional regulator